MTVPDTRELVDEIRSEVVGARFVTERFKSRVLTLCTRAVDYEAKLGAATTMLAEAERIVPGVIPTAGRFAVGLNDRERALAAEARVEELSEALRDAERELGEAADDFDSIAASAGHRVGCDEPDDPGCEACIANSAAARARAVLVRESGGQPEVCVCSTCGATPETGLTADCPECWGGGQP